MVKLKTDAEGYGVELTDDMLASFERYRELLLEWNEKMNLTAITDEQEILVKHFLDSLLVINAVDIQAGERLIDVGTGAGFPGVALKIVRGDINLTLLDSLNKRISFLECLSTALGQQNSCIHGRAEEMGRKAEYREMYDIATARAVASLSVLCEYCLPFIKVGGRFVGLKGYDIEQELSQAEKAIKILGGEVEAVEKYQLPMENSRSIVIIKKISQTPTKYPRSGVRITKSPL